MTKVSNDTISAMVRVIQALESQYIPALAAAHPLTGRAQCSINVIRGGVQINIIPEQCEIQVDRRLFTTHHAKNILAEPIQAPWWASGQFNVPRRPSLRR